MHHLGQRAGEHRLLLLGTLRPEALDRSGHPLKGYKQELHAHKLCEEIALSQLTQEHVARYLDSRFVPNDFPADLASLLHRRTEGHPLFATSLIHFLAERGDIALSDGRWSVVRPLAEMDLEVPENVRSMIRKKIDALDENTAVAPIVTGRLARAREAYDLAIPAARSLGNHRILANVLTYRGVLHCFQSEYAQAEAAEAEASRLAAEIRNGFYLAGSLMYLGISRANQGRLYEGLRTDCFRVVDARRPRETRFSRLGPLPDRSLRTSLIRTCGTGF